MKRSAFLLILIPAVALAGGRASHHKPENKMGANYWAAASAFDGKLETAWMVPGESENKGEWIEIDIPPGEVDKVAIYPGFGKSEESFKDYPRIKQVRVDVYHLDDDQNATVAGTATVDVADKAEMQVIDIADVKRGEGLFGGRVRFTVLDVYDGDDFPNLAVSEMQVMLKEFDARAKVAAVSAEANGHGMDALTDENPKTFWEAPAGSTLTIDPVGYGISSVGFMSVGKEYSRPKTVEITVQGLTRTTVLPDAPGPQFAYAPTFNGFNGGAFGSVEVKVVDTWPGTNANLGVAELKMKATTYEAL